MEEIRRLLAGGARLVTIWGSAGLGKTRLATEIAIAQRDRYAGETFLCELADARDAASLARVVASSLGVVVEATAAGEALVERIGDALAARPPMLVVADNLEQVMAPASAALELWTRVAPNVAWIATSRERTRLPAETAVDLAPLAVEGEGVPDAVQLFLDRIPRSSAESDAQLASAVAPLVKKLEGIPLAIELAAARFELLGLEGTMARLGHQLDTLAQRRGRVPRQATLRGALEWSWDLLGEAERKALARMAVFRGGFTVEAGVAVLDAGDGALDRIESLREKSLLRVESSRDSLRPARFALFEGVRELAAEKLEELPDEKKAAEALHAAHFLAIGEEALARFETEGSMDAVDAVAAEIENSLGVVETALARGDATTALRGALIVDLAIVTRGPFGAHLERLARAIELGERAAPKTLLARGLVALGRARGVAGLGADAEVSLRRALSIAERERDPALEATAAVELGIVRQRAADLDGATALYERALALATARGDTPRAEARVLGNLGAVHHDARRFDAAIEHYERALAILALAAPGSRDLRLLGIFSTNLGLLEQERGAMNEALRRYTQAVEFLEEAGDPRLLAIATGSLGSLHHEEGRLDEARVCHERALELLRMTADRRSQALGLARLGAALASRGRTDEARTALERGDRLAHAIGDTDTAMALGTSRAFLDIAAAQRAIAERRGDAGSSIASAKARAARAREGRPSAADRSDDVRAILRVLDRTLAALSPEDAVAGGNEPAGALLVTPDARWFRPPGGEWQDLRQREPARRLLSKLIDEQRSRPAEGVSLDALRQAGWPGEKIAREAAQNRIYVALNQLRKLGLKDVLQRVHGGYLLDPSVRVHRVAVEPEPKE